MRSRTASIVDKVGSNIHENAKIDTGPAIGARHVQILLLFFLTIVISGIRFSVSVAIIAMLDPTTSENPDVKTYNWDNKNVILSSFYWGYIVLQVFSAELTRFSGTKIILMISMFVNALAVILIPLIADHFGSYGVIVSRVIQGLFQGTFYPAVYTLLGKWAPTEERSIMTAIASAGGIIGIIITMPLTAYICKSWYGWPLCYYVFGSLGLLWIAVFFFFGSDSPQVCKTITEAERTYIETSLNKKQQHVVRMAPWKEIFTSMPVLAVTVSQIGLRWVQITIVSEMPLFMNGVLGFDLQANGILSALPYLVSLFVCLPIGRFSDHIINQKYLSRGTTRKLFTTISTTGTAVALLCLSFLPESQVMSMAMLVFLVGIDAVSYGGATPNIIDLSPNYSGIIMSISNASANISSIISPLLVQFIVTNDADRSQWAVVFCIGATITTLANVFYLMFASGEVQPWNDHGIEEASDTDKTRDSTKQV